MDIKELENLPRNDFVDLKYWATMWETRWSCVGGYKRTWKLTKKWLCWLEVLSDHVRDEVELCWWIKKNLKVYQEMTLLTWSIERPCERQGEAVLVDIKELENLPRNDFVDLKYWATMWETRWSCVGGYKRTWTLTKKWLCWLEVLSDHVRDMVELLTATAWRLSTGKGSKNRIKLLWC